MATMKMAVAKVPTAMYALCKPTVFPFEITALKLESAKGRAWVVAASASDSTSLVFTTPSKRNSSEKETHTYKRIHRNTHRSTERAREWEERDTKEFRLLQFSR